MLAKHIQVMGVVVDVVGVGVVVLPVSMVSVSLSLMVQIHIKLDIVFEVTSPAVVASVSMRHTRGSLLVVVGLVVLVIDFFMRVNWVVGALLVLCELDKVMVREDMLWQVLNMLMVFLVVFDLWSHELGVRQRRLLMGRMELLM